VFLLGLLVGPNTGVALVAGVSVAVVLQAVLSGRARSERDARTVQDSIAIASVLGSHTPAFGTWAIEADFGQLIAEELTRRQPEVIVECGSGASTVMIGAYLRLTGMGHLYSLEHQEDHAARVNGLLADADLGEWADIIVTPLTRHRFGRTETAWYDTDLVSQAIEGPVDLLIIDGPPSVVRWTRWPAVEVFHQILAPGAVVLLDDGRQRDMRRTAQRWQADHDDLELYWHDTLKGTWRVVKRSTPRQERAVTAALMAVRRRINPMPTGFGRWPVRR
jgi:predicted O-methyltransferase YrrM